MESGAWQATVHGVATDQTLLSHYHSFTQQSRSQRQGEVKEGTK